MENILCEHLGLFSATFPTSGMMHDGKLFPLQVQAHHTDVNGYSLLRTPVASEAEGGARHPDDAKAGGNTLKLGWQLLAHGGHIQPKLPTPTVSDQYSDNLASSQQTEGSMHSVTLAQIVNRPDLLPIPNTMDMLPARTPEQKEANRGKGGYSNLRESVVNDLLPTPQTGDGEKGMTSTPEHRKATGHQVMLSNHAPQLTSSWGKFEPAIRQWETITGNPAPPPTIPDGRDGQARLNPQFAEWMMGLQPGHITDCDITRNEQLKACGNGVVPQQATLAITRLMAGLNP